MDCNYKGCDWDFEKKKSSLPIENAAEKRIKKH